MEEKTDAEIGSIVLSTAHARGKCLAVSKTEIGRGVDERDWEIKYVVRGSPCDDCDRELQRIVYDLKKLYLRKN